MIKRVKEKISEKDIPKIIFCVSIFFNILIGILLVYNFDFTENYNLLFDSDTSRVINDMTVLNYGHYRLKVHPLFVILTEPVYFILKGIVINRMLSLVIISSLVTSLTVIYIYKLLAIYNKEKKTNVIISFCYLLAFSNMIFTAGIEIYNIATLFLVIFWYYVLKKNEDGNFDKYAQFIIIILGVLSMAFTITNSVVFLITLFILLIFKKMNFKKLLTIFLISTGILIAAINFQNTVWHNTPTLSSDNFNEETDYIDYKFNYKKIKNVIKNNYYNSIISSDVYLGRINNNSHSSNNNIISFKSISIPNRIILTIFYIALTVLMIRNFKYNIFANTGILLTLLFNSTLHFIYGNNSTFLYSLHFLYLFFISFGINISYEKNKTIKKSCILILWVLLIMEIIKNSCCFFKIIKLTEKILNKNYYLINFGLKKCIIIASILIIIIGILIYAIIKMIMRVKRVNSKDGKIAYSIIVVSLALIISCIFIALETTPIYNQLFFKKIDSKTEKITYGDKTELYMQYEKEIEALEEYEKEYTSFLKKHKNEKIKFLNKINYYFLGFGNRKKILYKDGKLIDLETKKEIYSFDIKSEEIIANLYTIILQTNKDEFIKIYEDNSGIHIIKDNKDTIIKGTDTYIELFKFENQAYQNIKKVLYGEILFNIKDGVIYPNILVYNKPWYRDAALACMVLKQTNNLDMISDWVKSIDQIYDKQNRGNKETDNLGELLYILSTQEDTNSSIINKIEIEAEKLANNNPDGYYIYGTTDFGEKYSYQNLWYKLGIESIGKEYKFNFPKTKDYYDNTTWWIEYETDKDATAILDGDYPYLSYAAYHKLKKGIIPLNQNLYPLSWEKNASEANYENMKILDEFYFETKISPLHVWSASELLLLIMDETNSLN